ncbi:MULTISPECIES: hypothetical protein [Rhodopseudomonas]|uniref:ATP-grasp domain-containing protein n=1 Tax=Rhodopseudomonas palustris TaxID=1076 RepID=A0A0D7ENC4_RHOPL|nr:MULTISPECIES: hypothetical protein [Rhodopseudomonas]KIZ42324.1 hypothetical protein OO17_13105 [Rhodopseudomonas palustris]MDF3812531.1 hypothetical protein [Rhodopseudomonas sp. BAL398]WOK17361.1 hypothetical protein RBJ75_25120 [Rhodopseudomonas sp. BAL398]
MPTQTRQRNEPTPQPVDRIGFSAITRMAYDGVSLMPLWQQLMAKVDGGVATPGDGLDLALVTQLLGEGQAGHAIQTEVLAVHQLFRSLSRTGAAAGALRVLALAADTAMGDNTPIEFLLDQPGVELTTLYVVPGIALPDPLPAHDVTIVIAANVEDSRGALAEIARLAPIWPAPLLNGPTKIRMLDRDTTPVLLAGIDGLEVPARIALTRAELAAVAQGTHPLAEIADGLDFPITARPRGARAGQGLCRIANRAALADYLAARAEDDFVVQRFVDTASEDGLFRKYRLVVIDGQPYACHMAISEQWNAWYVTAGMAQSPSKQLEEATFFYTFDFGFALRHRTPLTELITRIGLDYFTIDCAQDANGDLVVFEIGNTAVVHDMDSDEQLPYRSRQMNKLFDAFAAMLLYRARQAVRSAA